MNTRALEIMGGVPISVSGADPAANTEASITVPAGRYWKVLAFTVTCAQGATQTPWPYLAFKDQNGVTLVSYPGASDDMDAATTSLFTWAPGLALTAAAALTVNTAPIPSGLIVGPGFQLATATDGIGGNTNYGAPTAWVLEMP